MLSLKFFFLPKRHIFILLRFWRLILNFYTLFFCHIRSNLSPPPPNLSSTLHFLLLINLRLSTSDHTKSSSLYLESGNTCSGFNLKNHAFFFIKLLQRGVNQNKNAVNGSSVNLIRFYNNSLWGPVFSRWPPQFSHTITIE